MRYFDVLTFDVDVDAMHLVDPALTLDHAISELDLAELDDRQRIRLREIAPLRIEARYGISQAESISTEIRRLIRSLAGTYTPTSVAEELVAAALAGSLYGLAIDASTLDDDADWRTSRLVAIAMAQLESGDRGAAIETLEIASMHSENIDEISTLVEVVSAQATLGLIDAARSTLDSALSSIQEAIDEYEYEHTYEYTYWASELSRISIAQAELGDVEDARRTLDFANASLNIRPWYELQKEYWLWVQGLKVMQSASGNSSVSASQRQSAIQSAVQLADLRWPEVYASLDPEDILILASPENTGWLYPIVVNARNLLARDFEIRGYVRTDWTSVWAAAEASIRTTLNDPFAVVQSLAEQFAELFPEADLQDAHYDIMEGVGYVLAARGDYDSLNDLDLRSFSRSNIIFSADTGLRLSQNLIQAMLEEGNAAQISYAAATQFDSGLLASSRRLASAVPMALEASFQEYFYGDGSDYVPFRYVTRIMPVLAHTGMITEARNVLTRSLVAFRDQCLHQPRLVGRSEVDFVQDSCNSAYILGNILIWTALTEAMAA